MVFAREPNILGLIAKCVAVPWLLFLIAGNQDLAVLPVYYSSIVVVGLWELISLQPAGLARKLEWGVIQPALFVTLTINPVVALAAAFLRHSMVAP